MNPQKKEKIAVIIFFLFWAVYFALIWKRAVYFDDMGNVVAGNVNIWGDWPLHFTLGSAMAFREIILHTSPLLLDTPFSYPFICDLISALLIRWGVPFFKAFTIPSYITSLFFVASLYLFYKTLFKKRAIAIIGASLFLFNGGMGFLFFIEDIFNSQNFLHTLFYPPRTYTRMDTLGIHWISVITSMIIPQRSFQLGFPMALIALTIILKYLNPLEHNRRQATNILFPLILCSAILGYMPVIHAHSFVSLFIILMFWVMAYMVNNTSAFLKNDWKYWTSVFVITTIIALPLIFIFIYSNVKHATFFKWYPGWYTNKGEFGWLQFWWWNWGLTLIAVLPGLAVRIYWEETLRKRVACLILFFPFLLLFILPNLFLFQPWEWDNTKIVVWASLGFSGLSATLIYTLISAKKLTKSFRYTAGALLLIIMTLSGILDAYRATLPSLNTNRIYTKEEISIAQWVKKNTPVKSVWLTGSIHNHWLFNLTGRQPLTSYTGWLWTHGYDYYKKVNDTETFYRNPDKKKLINKYGIDYVVIGPFEKNNLKADPEEFAIFYKKIRESNNYIIFNCNESPVNLKPVPFTLDLEEGVIRTVYNNARFSGKIFKQETGVTSLQFDYTNEKAKPWRSPFSIVWEGYLRIRDKGSYTFSMASDDGSWFFINDRLIIDNGGVHELKNKSTTLYMTRGYYKLKIKYFDQKGSAIFRLKWKTPRSNETTLLNKENLYHFNP